MTDRVTVIAIDGPAASGKGTLARRLAEHLGLRHLDSGRLYRAVASRLLREGHDPGDAAVAAAVARSLTEDDLHTPDLRDEAIGQAASIVAPMTDVREALLDYQRDFAAAPPGAVVDGRDIGSVVFTDADYKFFVTASPRVRVARRCKELEERGVSFDYKVVWNEMVARDERDQRRAVAPLIAADGAYEIDTSELDADGAFRAALIVIRGGK